MKLKQQIKRTREDKIVHTLLWCAVLCNIAYWLWVRDAQSKWLNVPPAPDQKYASATGLGDASLAYRMNGISIQNMGDTGGRTTSLKDYNFEHLNKWFLLQDSLDRHSDFIPYLASFYFGGVQEPEKFRPVLDYLETVGKRPEGEKWRWLAQAVWLARFRMNDLNKAEALAEELAKVDNPNMPAWPRNMPAYIKNAKGEKEAAYAIMLELIKTKADKLHPEEVNAMRAYICEQVLTEKQAETNPLCQDTP